MNRVMCDTLTVQNEDPTLFYAQYIPYRETFSLYFTVNDYKYTVRRLPLCLTGDLYAYAYLHWLHELLTCRTNKANI